METMMQEKMTESSMQEMNENSSFGDMAEMKRTLNAQMKSLFQNQICDLKEKQKEANAQLGCAVRDNTMRWTDKNNLRMACSVLDGQMAIVKNLQNNFETLFAPMAME